VSSLSPDSRASRRVDSIALLKGHPVFGALAPDQIKRLGSFARIRWIASGTTLFVKGDPSTELFTVVSGTVKVALSSSDGREKIVASLHAGEFFGEIALLDGQPRTAEAFAATDCELMVIKRCDYLGFVDSEPKVATKIIAFLCGQLRIMVARTEELAFLDLPTRLARLLVRLLEKNASADKGKLAITQQEISEMLGTSRESVNKHLQIWAKHKVIGLKRGAIVVLAPQALRALGA
jgi:CRP/FNR family transcriptional regulator, cyclic AMP receptor protein